MKVDKKKAEGNTKKIEANHRIYPTTVKWTHDEIIQIQLRANALGVSRAEYLRLQGLKPIDELKETRKKDSKRKALTQAEIAAYLTISKELNRQDINLNQITTAINLARIEGNPVQRCLDDINEISSINRQILESIRHLKASHDR